MHVDGVTKCNTRSRAPLAAHHAHARSDASFMCVTGALAHNQGLVSLCLFELFVSMSLC